MSLMDFLDDVVLGPLNLVDRAQGLAKGIVYKDFGYRFAIPRIDKGGRFTLKETEDLLKRYGVDVFGRTHDSQNMYFLVKKRQARWAEYLMLQAGVKLTSPVFDQRNTTYTASRGRMPKPWSESVREKKQKSAQKSGLKDLLDYATGAVRRKARK